MDVKDKMMETTESYQRYKRACIRACTGIPVRTLEAGSVRELIEAAQEYLSHISVEDLGTPLTKSLLRFESAVICIENGGK